MISSEHFDLVRIAQLQTTEEDDDFNGTEAPVDIVSEEEEFALGEAAVNNLLEHMNHVEELPVDVSDCHAG